MTIFYVILGTPGIQVRIFRLDSRLRGNNTESKKTLKINIKKL
jgi:hypothetical protein